MGGSSWRGWAIAVAALAAASALRWALDPWLSDRYPLQILVGAVAVTAFFADILPSAFMAVVGYALVNYFFLEPRYTFRFANVQQIGGVIAYVISCACVIAIGAAAQRYQRQVKREKDLLAVTLAGIGDGVITCDADGRVTMLNCVAEMLTGWTNAAARLVPIDEVFRIVDEKTRAKTPNPVFRAITDQRIVGLANHTLLLTRDGRETPIDESAAPIVHEGRVVGAVLVFRDVSERKKAFEALAETDRRKSEFLAILGHELRSPLSAVVHGAEAIRTRPDDPRVVDIGSQIVLRQGRQLTRLVDDLLDMSRIEKGTIRLQAQRIALEDVVNQAAEAAAEVMGAHGHTLRIELPETPVELEADGQRLAQVLGNLLTNAARYSPQPGEIRIAARRDGDALKIGVTDHGMGIRPEDMEKLFHLYSRLRPGIERLPGLGIGLALSRSLVELHGGSIEVKSDGPGKGSCFTVTLPLAAGPGRPADRPLATAG